MLRHLKTLDSLPKYLLAAILIIVPLYPKFPFINVPGTYVAIRFEDLLLLFLGAVTVIKIVPNLRRFLKDPIVISLLLFFCIGFISAISGAFLTKTIPISIGLIHVVRRIEYTLPFFAVLVFFNKQRTREYLNFFLKTLIIVTIVALVYGLGQRYLRFPVIITQNDVYSRGTALFWVPGSHINSTFAGHYDLAAFEVITLPILIAAFFILKNKLSKLFILLSMGGGMWLLINSISRIAQVSYILAVFVSLVLIRKYKALAITLLISLILIASSASLESRFRNIFKVIVRAEDQMVAVVTPTPVPLIEDRSTSIRLKVEWPRAIRALTKNPLLGTGYSSITLATDNDYLRALGETGILGFLSFCLIFINIGKVLYKALPITKKFSGIEMAFITGTIGALAGTFLTATFIDIFEASKFAIIFWMLIGISVFLARNIKNVQEN